MNLQENDCFLFAPIQLCETYLTEIRAVYCLDELILLSRSDLNPHTVIHILFSWVCVVFQRVWKCRLVSYFGIEMNAVQYGHKNIAVREFSASVSCLYGKYEAAAGRLETPTPVSGS